MGDVISIKKARGISGSTLKIIAIVCMVIDHLGASVLEKWLIDNNWPCNLVSTIDYIRQPESIRLPGVFYDANITCSMLAIVMLYWCCRIIGRIAFPIYAFLITEGIEHTKNAWKYFLRLFLFALISEVPFDLAFFVDPANRQNITFQSFVDLHHQNVFFTLAISVVCLIGIKKLWESTADRPWRICGGIVISVVGALVAELLHTDYGWYGVGAIVLVYAFRYKRLLGCVLSDVFLTLCNGFELSAFLSLWPIGKYNGHRGSKLKWVFYTIYPLHLLMYWGIRLLLGV